MRQHLNWTLAVAFTTVLAACSSGSHTGTNFLPQSEPVQSGSASSYIKHVVIVVQENHSFDNLFATFPGADGTKTGKMNTGQTVKLHKTNLFSPLLLDNSHQAFVVEYDGGKMDGFNAVYVSSQPCPKCAYAYVNPKQIVPYWTMAQQYGLADHMFTTETSGSFNGHQDLIRGDTVVQTGVSLIDFPTHGPWGCDAPPGTTIAELTSAGKYITNGPFPCTTAFPQSSNYDTLRDLLDKQSVSWKYFTPALLKGGLPGAYWDAYDVISAVRNGPEWKNNIISPETKVFGAISGTLPGVTWVIPDGVNSDHAGIAKSDKGPSWVASIVNAIGQSQYWDSTAIIILWDDWGGWYDHVPPPQLDYAGLGFRVPMILVSPYAKPGYVSHTQYEFGSVIKFVEEVFNLGSLGTTDQRANSIDDMFNFKQQPRPFKVIPAKYKQSLFEHEAPSNIPPDTN